MTEQLEDKLEKLEKLNASLSKKLEDTSQNQVTLTFNYFFVLKLKNIQI